jgi:PAS domain S-box-containing protein
VFVVLVYIIAVLAFRGLVGQSIAVLALIPVSVIGAVWGGIGGIIAGVLWFPFTIALLFGLGETFTGDEFVRSIPVTIVAMFVGGVIGKISYLDELLLGATKKASENEAFYQVLVNASPEGVVVVDEKQNIVFMSPRAAELFALVKHGRDINRNFMDFVSEDYKGKIKADFDVAAAGEIVVGASYQLVNDQGRSLVADVHIAQTITNDKVPGAFVVFVDDKTKDSEREVKLTDQNQQLDKLNKLMVGRELRIAELKRELNEARLKQS